MDIFPILHGVVHDPRDGASGRLLVHEIRDLGVDALVKDIHGARLRSVVQLLGHHPDVLVVDLGLDLVAEKHLVAHPAREVQELTRSVQVYLGINQSTRKKTLFAF